MNSLHRFQDPTRPPTPEMKRYAKRFMKGISLPHHEQISVFREAYSREDPLADTWIQYSAEALTREESAHLVEMAIRDGIGSLKDPPQTLKALFDTLEARPKWLDDDLLALARKTVRRSGPLGNWLLVNVALMGGYRYEGVIQPLLMTGRLTEYAPKRLADTTQFVQDVLSTSGLERGAKGYAASIRVRLLHAHIRFHLRDHKEWSHERWGAPVNQADMVATLLLFSLSYLVTSEALGLKFSPREAESVIHLWRYVGLLLGVDEPLIPKTEAEARQSFYLVGMSQSLAGPEAATLGRALHEVPIKLASGRLEKLQARLAMSIRSGVSQLFLGDEAMAHLGVPSSLFRFLLMGAVPAIYTLERIRPRIPMLNELITTLGGYWQDQYTAQLIRDSHRLYKKKNAKES